jgi:hypothetical protein
MVRRNRGLVPKVRPQRESNVPAGRAHHPVGLLRARIQLGDHAGDAFVLAKKLEAMTKRADPASLDVITSKIASLITAPVPPYNPATDELRGPLERYSKRSAIKSSLSEGWVAMRPTCHAT